MSASSEGFPIDTVLDGRYRLISEGTPQDLGIRYTAHDLRRDRQVALLVLWPRWGGGAEAVQRLQEVQRAVADLAAPNLLPFEYIGQVSEADVQTPALYLVRAHPEAQTLADLLAQTGRLDVRSAVEITARLCEALAPAHHAGLVHGSLAPSSVLVSRSEGPGEPLRRIIAVVDVGLLPALWTRDVPPGRPWGRTPYLSPEQAAGEEIHPAADVYVIGSLLYEMLTGRPPFRASDEMVLALQHLRQEPPSLQVLVPDIPPALVQIVQKALAKEPSVRYRNAGQLAQILRSQVGLASSAPQPKPAARAPAQQHLVVPPPPAQSPVTSSVRTGPRPPEIADAARPYDFQAVGDRAPEPAGVDWLMIGLLIAALIAVLGLIPLWRTVYRRYAAPPAAYAPVLYSALVRLPDGTGLPDAVLAPNAIRSPDAVYRPYIIPEMQTAGRLVSAGRSRSAGRLAKAPPMDECGLHVWESSLRVWKANCCKLCGQFVTEA
jgi:eukaryotic-like serine/threonine-protein kinase